MEKCTEEYNLQAVNERLYILDTETQNKSTTCLEAHTFYVDALSMANFFSWAKLGFLDCGYHE